MLLLLLPQETIFLFRDLNAQLYFYDTFIHFLSWFLSLKILNVACFSFRYWYFEVVLNLEINETFSRVTFII